MNQKAAVVIMLHKIVEDDDSIIISGNLPNHNGSWTSQRIIWTTTNTTPKITEMIFEWLLQQLMKFNIPKCKVMKPTF
jgi:fructose-1-phosphate kinase PfkB-like protein